LERREAATRISFLCSHTIFDTAEYKSAGYHEKDRLVLEEVEAVATEAEGKRILLVPFEWNA
jgi:hypothetical protein